MQNLIERFGAGLFASIILIFGIWAVPNLYFPGNTTSQDVIRGISTGLIEDRYEELFPMRDWFTSGWAAFNYSLFRDGRDGVLVGKEEWLFTTEEFHWRNDSLNNLEKTTDYIADVAAFLAAKDIEVFVILLPEKADVYRKYSDKTSMHVQQDVYQKALNMLSKNNVQAYSARTPLKQTKTLANTFMRTDTHWSPFGASLVAKGFADSYVGLKGEQTFVTEQIQQEPFSGDLMEFIPVDPYFNSFGPKAETLTRYITESGTDDSALGLFDEPVYVDLALVGTSYSANQNWHFIGFLKSELKRDLLDFSEEGKGPFMPMQKLLANDTLTTQGIQQVIWEIPARYLVQSLPSTVIKP